MADKNYDYFSSVIILGSGPAGYSAAIYCARALLKPMLITGLQQGGQLTSVGDIENYPGFKDPIPGPFLVEEMAEQAKKYGTNFVYDTIKEVNLSNRIFLLKGDNDKIYACEALIVATGATAKWLGLESEERYKGKGVSACATCDGFFYKNKHVAVIGGGNVAVEEALYLSNIAEKVTLIHRRETLRAERILQERLFSRKNITILWNHIVKDILGHENEPSDMVAKLLLEDTATQRQHLYAIDGVFIAIGHNPQTEIFQPYLTLDKSGYIITSPNSTRTNIEGVFAAGDVTNTNFRQAIVAAGQGCVAALEVERFLEHKATET